MTVPYSPPLLDTPFINPAAGGYQRPFPYVSPSQYTFAPTAMDLSNLVTGPNATGSDQRQALSDLIRRASSEIDRYLFGASPSAKQPSLCATNNVEAWWFKVIQGTIRVACDYAPIIALTGMDVGLFANQLATIGPEAASQVTTLRHTFIVPVLGVPPNSTGLGPNYGGGYLRTGQRVYVVWSYDNGYPHTILAEPADAGDTELVVEATSAAGGLIGVWPGVQLDVLDYALSDVSGVETITVESVAANTPGTATVGLAAPLQYGHTPPAAPDFIPVTAIPWAVQQAAIHAVTCLVKERGDDALLLEGAAEARTGEENPGEKTVDVVRAFRALQSYRTTSKIKT